MNAPTTIKWKGVTFSVRKRLTLKELSAKTSPQFVSLLKSLSDRGNVLSEKSGFENSNAYGPNYLYR